MTRQTILLGDKLYEVERERGWQNDPESLGWSWAQSRALVCPKCLSIWAVMAFEGDEYICPAGAFCDKHPPSERYQTFAGFRVIPGSILPDYWIDLPLLAALPEELLKRELLLTLRQLES